MCRSLSVMEELSRGVRVRLTWHPDRTCDIEYHGNLHFEVVGVVCLRQEVGSALPTALKTCEIANREAFFCIFKRML